jgi:hypothetical protein
VKDGLGNNKSYILLLTCASSRAIHLELVPDMSVHGFLRGFKRFMARRGIPDLVINDNFKTFKSAEVKKFMKLQGILFKQTVFYFTCFAMVGRVLRAFSPIGKGILEENSW